MSSSKCTTRGITQTGLQARERGLAIGGGFVAAATALLPWDGVRARIRREPPLADDLEPRRVLCVFCSVPQCAATVR